MAISASLSMSKRCSASPSTPTNSSLKALSLSGRLSVSVTIWPCRSYSTSAIVSSFEVASSTAWCHASRQVREETMAKRKSINYPGFSHQNPIPNASRIGNILMSSVISGRDPATGTMPPELDAQVANVFKQIRLCVEAAGGTVDDIIKVNFWMKDPATGRKALNGEWSAMFPDPESRPALHTLALPQNAANHVTCDFTAVIGG